MGYCCRHTLRGCVDWNMIGRRMLPIVVSHTLRGCVDWNIKNGFDLDIQISHTLRGCVDWNCGLLAEKIEEAVTPCVGVWIETGLSGYIIKLPDVTPCVGVWIETKFRYLE